eukprot:2816710-Pyramimonas_sp.AAC.1
MTWFYGSFCANDGKGALNTPETRRKRPNNNLTNHSNAEDFDFPPISRFGRVCVCVHVFEYEALPRLQKALRHRLER